MADETRIFHFHSDAVADDTFQVAGMKGLEEFSAPYQFELDLLSKKVDVPLDKMLTTKAWIAVRQAVPVSGGKQGTKINKIQGIVSTFEVLEKIEDYVKYRAVLVPRVWKCSLTTQSRVFQKVTIKDIIQEVLTEKGGSGLTADDFSVQMISGTHKEHEFIVQYNESDLDFLHRWLEYEGVFYYFDQTEKGEKLVFADSTGGYAKLPGEPKIPYRPDPASRSRSSGSAEEQTLQEQCVHSFRCRARKTTKEVVLKDYNYRTPTVEVKAKADVANPAGEGKMYVYGEHFKTPSDGTALATIRAEEIQCRDTTFDGTGDHRSFRPGTKFTLSEHYRPDFNAAYVITSVSHQLSQGTEGDAGSNVTYRNDFTCIPASDNFRPERRTPWPSIHGFLNATIDAGGDGKYAEIDDQGRYKVKLPFDLSDKKDGKASRYLRMAQPYAGGGMGMHFPLHKGTEVLIGFIDGDVDRPIIASAIPNPETSGPVSGKNSTQCAVHTGGGNQLVIEDTDGSQQIKLASPTQGTHISLGAPNSDGHISMGSGGNMNSQLGGNNVFNAVGNEDRQVGGDTMWSHIGAMVAGFFAGRKSATVGADTSTVTGTRVEATGGNIAEAGKANKVSVISSSYGIKCSNMGIKVKSAFALSAGSVAFIKSKNVGLTGSVKVVIKSGGTNGTWTPGAWNLKSKKVGIESTGEATIKSGAKMAVEAKGGDLSLTGDNIGLNTKGKLAVAADGEVSIKGSATKIGKGAIELQEDVTCKKKVQIDGDLKVKGTNFTVE